LQNDKGRPVRVYSKALVEKNGKPSRRQGLVGVSWLDRRNDPANIDYQAFAAISSDGGMSFGENVQLTTAFSNPNVNGYPNNEWMGDYPATLGSAQTLSPPGWIAATA